MFGENLLADAARAFRAITTNQIARAMPRTYFRAVEDTGRGPNPESPEALARYCVASLADYEYVLDNTPGTSSGILRGARVLEYGPGDFLGVAVALVGKGASSVTCVDRFPLARSTPHNTAAYETLLDALTVSERRRADCCFNRPGRPASGVNPAMIRYVVQRSGLIGERDAFDVVLSRAVLEHVDHLEATMQDTAAGLRAGGRAIHLVDLSSHRLHRANPLDFLTWPDWLWRLMYSHKGVPNRLRIDSYRKAAARAHLEILKLEASKVAPLEWVRAVRPHLAPRFREVSDEDLACLGFWLVCEKNTFSAA